MANSAKDIVRAQILNSASQPQPRQQQQATPTRPIDIVRAQIAQSTPTAPAPVQTVAPQPVTPTPAPTPAPQTTTPSFLNNLFETLGIASQQAQRAVTGVQAPVETQQAENNRLAELGAARAGAAQERKRLEELRAQVEQPQSTQPKPNPRRDEILSEMRDMEANAGYIADEQTANEQEAKWRELTEELRDLDRSLGEPERDYTSTNAARDFASSWAQNYGNGIRATVGSLGQLGAEAGARLHDASSDEQRAVASSDYSGWATDELSAANIAAGTEAKTGAEIMADEKESSDRIFQKALEADKEQKEKFSRVLTGRTPLEQTALQVARTGLDVLADSALSAMTGGFGGQARMYGSVYGQGAMEQAEKGGDVYQRNLAGAKAALSALLSTKLLGGVETAYGKSVVGKASGNAIRKLAAQHPALANPITQRVIRSVTNTEGLEEGLEDILNYAGDRLLNLDRETPFDWDAWKQDMLIGHIIGSVASGVEFKPADFRLLVDEEVADAAGVVDDTPRTDTPIPPENASPYQQIAARHKSTIRAANDILRNPEALASFVEAHGELTGASNTERAGEIAAILRAEQTGTVQLAEPAKRGQDGQPLLVDRPRGMNGPTEAEANKQTSNRMADIILEVLRGETTPAKARQIVDNPTLRALYETVYGVQLPDSRAKAKQMVLDSEPNPEGEQALAEARAQAFTSPVSEPVETAPAQQATETPVEAAQPVGDIPAPPQTTESTTAQPQTLNSAQQVPTQNTQGMNTGTAPAPAPTTVEARGKNRERSFTQNVESSDYTEEALSQSLGEHKEIYRQLTNTDVLKRAQEIFDEGADKARSTLEQALGAAQNGAKFPPEMVPLARMVANDLTRRGDVETARSLIADVAAELTAAGQLSQVGKILRNTDPATAMMSIQKALDQINKTIEKRYGRRYTWRAALTDAEIKQINSTDFTKAGAYEEVYEQIAKRLGKDMPSTLWEKLSEIRRVGMLLRPRTQLKNVASNVPMIPMRRAAEKLSGAIQDALVKTGHMVADAQTRASKVSAETKKLAKDYTKEHKAEILDGGNKADMDTLLNKHRTIFKDGPLTKAASKLTDKDMHNLMENARNLAYKCLELGDAPFVLKAYEDSLAQICEARGVTDASKITAEMRDFAFANAMEATYKATNVIAEALNKIKREGGAMGKALDVIIPFTTTPANILSLMGKYSPVGFAAAIHSGLNTASGIDAASKATVGSAFMALGFALRALGAAKIGKDKEDEKPIDKALHYLGITGAADKNTNKAAFDKATGISPYSFGGKYSYDWAEPFGSMLALGAEVYDSVQGQETWADALLNAMYTAGDAVLDMSLFQNVTKMLKGYGSNTEAIAQSLLQGGATQLMPGLAGDVAKIIDEYQRSTYTGGNAFDETKARLLAVTPGGSKKLPASVNVFGEKVSRGDTINRIIDTLITPWNTNHNKATATSNKIKKVFEETGDYSVFPSTSPAKVEVGDETYKMDGKERAQFQTTQGQTYTKIVEQMIDGSLWKDMTAEDKAAALTSARDFSKDEGKRELLENRDIEYESSRWNTEHDFPFNHLGEYLSFKNQFNKAQKNSDFATLDKLLPKLDKVSEDTRDTMYEKNARLDDMKAAADKGINSEEWTRAYDQYKAINKKDEGATDKAEEMKTWLRTGNWTKSERELLESQFKYYTSTPAEAKTYDKLDAALDDPKKAQHYSGLVRSDDADNAAEVLTAISNDRQYSLEDKEKALSVYLTESQYAAYERAKAENISMGNWAKFLSEVSKAHVERTGKGGNPSKADIQAACNAMGWTTKADFDQVYKVYKGN